MCFIKNSFIKKYSNLIFSIFIFLFYTLIYLQKIVPSFIVYGEINFTKRLLVGNIIILCSLLFLIKLLFKGRLNSIESSEKMRFKKTVVISFFIAILIVYITKGSVFIQKLIFTYNKSFNTNGISGMVKKVPFLMFLFLISTSILEEVVYRQILFGFLYDIFKGCNKYVRILTSAFISSILFGGIHDGFLNPNMLQYIVNGLVYSGIYLYTKRISSSISVHILYNLRLFLLDLL